MSAPTKEAAAVAASAESYRELALRIYVQLSANIYATGTQNKPDPKALAAFSFKLAAFTLARSVSFSAASKEAKENVDLSKIDMTGMFANTKK